MLADILWFIAANSEKVDPWVFWVIIAVVFVFFSILILFINNYLKAEPNEALIFTGRKFRKWIIDEKGEKRRIVLGWRAIVGGARLKIPVIEKVSRLSLELMNLPSVRVEAAYSKEGVPVTVESVANVKISSEEGMLARAVERFLSASVAQVKQIIRETLEGQLRDIIGFLTVEELYQKREMFVNRVLEQAGDELSKIGVIIDIINIQDIRDDRGYLEALGEKRTAEVMRDAEIGKAEAMRDAMIRAETARREGEVVRSEQERQISEAEKERDVAQQTYLGETLGSQKKAEQQGPLAEAKARQAVVREQQKVLEEEQKARELYEKARAEAEEQRFRADTVIPAEANRDAKILEAEGEAAKILKIKEAEATGIKKIMLAEAEGLERKAKAWEKFGEAAQLNLMLEAMKIIAEKGADALGQINFANVVAIDSGSGDGSGSSGAISRVMTAAPAALVKFSEQLKALTGIDLNGMIKKRIENFEEEYEDGEDVDEDDEDEEEEDTEE